MCSNCRNDGLGGRQASSKLKRENEVGQLALPVCGPLRIASVLPLQIIEVDIAEMRGKTGDHNDAG
jgi:hypothetical protein